MDNIPLGYNNEGEPIGFNDPRAVNDFKVMMEKVNKAQRIYGINPYEENNGNKVDIKNYSDNQQELYDF